MMVGLMNKQKSPDKTNKDAITGLANDVVDEKIEEFKFLFFELASTGKNVGIGIVMIFFAFIFASLSLLLLCLVSYLFCYTYPKRNDSFSHIFHPVVFPTIDQMVHLFNKSMDFNLDGTVSCGSICLWWNPIATLYIQDNW